MKLFKRRDPDQPDFRLGSIHGEEVILEGISPEQVNADIERALAWNAAELQRRLGHLLD